MLVQPNQVRSYYAYNTPKQTRGTVNTFSNNANYMDQQAVAGRCIANQVSFSGKQAVRKILDKSIVFGLEEYNGLSHDEWAILRCFNGMHKKYDEKTKKFILSFGECFSERMHELYPDGFTFVSIGRSPAFLAKRLEFEGEDVRYCPISNLTCTYDIKFTPYFIEKYKEYLDTIGLTKDFAEKTDKPIVFVDYVHDGYTISNFKRLLASPEIGIKKGENVQFMPIAARGRGIFDICRGGVPSGRLFEEMMGNECTKEYTSIPRIDVRRFEPRSAEEKALKEFYQNGNRFKEDFETKMMNFTVIDDMMRPKKYY